MKSVKEKQILYDITYMLNIKKKGTKVIYLQNGFTDIKNKLNAY